MDAMIQCPVCGESNSEDSDYCQQCNSPLHPDVAPLKPGELPTKKKNTAQLEPILPQWLRDAREQSRQTAQEEDPGMQTLKSQPAPEQPAHNVDFLAGLQSHAKDDDEDETPDWLASITGVSNKPKKTESEPADVRWVEMGGRDDFAQDAPSQDAESDTPSWLANIQSQPKTEKDELTDWFKEAAAPSSKEPNWLDEPVAKNDFTSQSSEPLSSSDTPDWLRQMQANETSPSQPLQADPSFSTNDDTPDWLKSMSAADTAQNNQAPAGQTFDAGDDAPDWLKRMDETDPAGSGAGFSSTNDAPAWLQQPAAPQADDDVPGWLNTLDAQQKDQALDPAPFSEPIIGGADAGFTSSEDTPDWLKNMQPEEPKAPPLKGTSPLWLRDESAAEAEDANVPSWLASTPPMAEQQPPTFESSAFEATEESPELGDIPNWLKAAAPQSSIFSEPAAEADPSQTFSSDTPDWLSAFKSVEGSQPASPFANEKQPEQEFPAPAFTENSFEGLGDNSLFNETPDWLSNAIEPASSDSPLTSNSADDSLAAGELPSWVQAMRPVEGSRAGSGGMSTNEPLESRGALAGLQGVLPSVPGYTPSSKPKAYSILLQATDEQKSHALLLEQILAAEAEPQPIASYAPLAASRPLRWFIAAAVFAFVSIVLGMRTAQFSVPSVALDANNSRLNPLNDALYVVQHIPDNAPVLVVMDYQPSRAAELEAAALPLFDQMDLLHHPGLYFVSTNEMGSILTERLVSLRSASMESLRVRYQQTGQSLINLGYLPGGEMGVRAFVQNPFLVMPQDITGSPSRLQENGISINQFVTIIVMTDNAGSAQDWIEQTQTIGYPFPLVFVTSSQAGVMLQPYYDSSQIKGIVNGLHDAAIVEKIAGRFVTARGYWDAYSVGMWLAMLLLVLGGLWNLALGLRDRSMTREIM
jgi:hypothetical protein